MRCAESIGEGRSEVELLRDAITSFKQPQNNRFPPHDMHFPRINSAQAPV
jgi:hypothetical protein